MKEIVRTYISKTYNATVELLDKDFNSVKEKVLIEVSSPTDKTVTLDILNVKTNKDLTITFLNPEDALNFGEMIREVAQTLQHEQYLIAAQKNTNDVPWLPTLKPVYTKPKTKKKPTKKA